MVAKHSTQLSNKQLLNEINQIEDKISEVEKNKFNYRYIHKSEKYVWQGLFGSLFLLTFLLSFTYYGIFSTDYENYKNYKPNRCYVHYMSINLVTLKNNSFSYCITGLLSLVDNCSVSSRITYQCNQNKAYLEDILEEFYPENTIVDCVGYNESLKLHNSLETIRYAVLGIFLFSISIYLLYINVNIFLAKSYEEDRNNLEIYKYALLYKDNIDTDKDTIKDNNYETNNQEEEDSENQSDSDSEDNGISKYTINSRPRMSTRISYNTRSKYNFK